MDKTYAGIVLAGGESRRYGTPKALEKFGGVPFYELAVKVLEPFVEHIVIVAHPSIINDIPKQDGVTIILDESEFKGDGPLAGIYSGMKVFQASHYLVLACDMPLMDKRIYQQLTSLSGYFTNDVSIIPSADSRLQPLAAIYSSSTRPIIHRLLSEKQRRLLDLLKRIDCVYLEYTSETMSRCFKNVNTPDDYNEVNH